MALIPVKAYSKRPSDSISVTFDFRPFATGVSPAVVTYSLKSQTGIYIEQQQPQAGLFVLSLYGGIAGRHYIFGIEARSTDGMSKLDLRRLRVREPIESVTAVDINPSTVFILVDNAGNVLVDAGDLALTVEA
jgi:hypothetical protein